MAIYVWSGATGSGNGSNWTNAYTTLMSALNAVPAHTAVFIAHDHVENNTGNISYSQGSVNITIRVLCADRLGSFPPTPADYRETAIISTTGTITFGGSQYFRGIVWRPGNTGTSTPADMGLNSLIRYAYFDRCLFDFSGNTGASRFLFNGNGCFTHCRNCKWKFNNVGSHIRGEGYSSPAIFESTDGRKILTDDSVVPNFLMFGSITSGYTIRGYDLTQLENRKIQGNQYGQNLIENCRLSPLATLSNISLSNTVADMNTRAYLEIYNCAADGEVPFNSFSNGVSNVFNDTTTYLVGGTEHNGIPYSWHLDMQYWTNGTSRVVLPDGVFWNDVVGSPMTLTWEVLSRHPLGLDHLYVDVRFLGTPNSTIESQVSTLPDGAWAIDITPNTASPFGNLPTSTATWVTPDGFTNKHQLSVTFTPQRAGLVKWQIFAAQPQFWPEPNIYVNFRPTISV